MPGSSFQKFFFVLFVFLPTLTQDVSGQVFPRLRCEGEMPDDFRLRYSEKYRNTVQEVQEGRRTTGRKKEFVALTTIAMDNLFRSGKVLYGDEVTIYCNKVLDNLLRKDPELRQQIRLYTLRSNEVNAFSTHQGIVLISTGLIARLENEAQLAFVLAHEIAHYVKKHVLEGYLYDKKLFEDDLRSGNASFDESVLESARYSREAETEADEYGWELYQRGGYAKGQVLLVQDILLYSYLPVVNREFQYGTAEDRYFKFNEEHKEYTPLPVQANDQVDDSRHTHPNTFKRKMALTDKLKKATYYRSDTLFKQPEEEFRRIVERAKLEVVYNSILEGKYISGLMLCDAWLDSSGSRRPILIQARAMCYYGIQTQLNNGVLLKRKEIERPQGPQVSYFHLFYSLNPAELNVLAMREIWRMHQADTGNPFVKRLLDASLHQVINKTKLRPGLFLDAGGDTNRFEDVMLCYTCDKAFLTDEFKPLKVAFINAEKQADSAKEASPVEAGTNDSGYVFPDVERLMLFNPRYFGMDLRKPVDSRFLKSDEEELKLETMTNEVAKSLGMELVIPDSRKERENITKEFNDYVSLMDWLEEYRPDDHDGFVSFLSPDIETIRSDYQVEYLAASMYWSLTERKRFNIALLSLSAAVPYAFPAYLYWQLTPRQRMGYSFIVVNMKSTTLAFGEVKNMKAKYKNYLIKAHLYNSLNQIRK